MSEEAKKGLRYVAAGFALLTFVGLLLGAVWGLSSTYTRNHIQAEEAARDYAQRADQQIRQRCLRLASAAMPECITVAIRSAREDQRGERNLEAQENTATWTGAMAILAGLGLLISVGGIGLVYLTFQQARRSADAAQQTYQAFVDIEAPRLVIDLTDFAYGAWIGFNLSASNVGKTGYVLTGLFTGWWPASPGLDSDDKLYFGHHNLSVIPTNETVVLKPMTTTVFDLIRAPILAVIVEYDAPGKGRMREIEFFRVHREKSKPHGTTHERVDEEGKPKR